MTRFSVFSAVLSSVVSPRTSSFSGRGLSSRRCATAPVRAGLILPIVLALGACSDDGGGSSSTLIDLRVQVGQEDFNEAMVRRVTVTEAGQPAEVEPGVLNFARFTTDDEGLTVVSADATELVYLDAYGRTNDGAATTRRCQLVDGCGSVDFAGEYSITAAPGWRSVVADAEDNQLVRVTPFTDLAAGLAKERVYSESSGDQQNAGWLETGFYSVYSVYQAESQVSRLFGIDSVQTREPADLTQLREWRNTNTTEATASIRYGALLAAWQSFELSYTPTADLPSLASAVAADLVTNDGQLYKTGGGQTISMYELFDVAVKNLSRLSTGNATVDGYIASVVAGLEADRDSYTTSGLTSVTPASLADLLGDSLGDYQLGIDRAKAFVNELRDYTTNFFEDGHFEALEQYSDVLQTIGEDNAANLDVIASAMGEIADFYRDCYLSSGCPSPDSGWSWYQSHSYSGSVLTLNNGKLVVSQAVADVNLLDDDDSPSSSRAIDVLMRGSLESNGLVLELDHTYDADGAISSPSGMRIFYATSVSVLQDEVAQPATGYQIRWTDFTLYDEADLGTDAENELAGAFSILYQGVDDPDGAGNRRFNIAEVVLNSRISDVYDDEASTDSNITTLFVTASANQAGEYYPDSEFSSFNAFFDPAPDYPKGYVSNGLVQYMVGTEQINGRTVQYLDYFVEGGDDFRYRFYPTIYREDVSDIDGDGDVEEEIPTSDYEACELSGAPGSASVVKCDPKQRLNAEQDLQKAVNELWQLGVFSRPEVQGQGVYFVEFPVVGPDASGCLTLQDLPTSLSSLDGTLYRSAQLGLSSARLTSEIVLDYTSANDPKTLIDVQVSAPYSQQANVSVGISHDYTSVDTTGLYRGVGADLDRLIFDFSTESGVSEVKSLSVFKDGVSLTLADGSTDTVDSEIILGSELSLVDGAPVYRYIVGDDGNYRRCVVSNTAEPAYSRDLQDADYVLNYRDKVYGKITNDSGTWIVRYIDGTWETLF